MAQVKITQVRSLIKKPITQKRTIAALGLGKINRSVIHEVTPQLNGMLAAVNHLVIVENI